MTKWKSTYTHPKGWTFAIHDEPSMNSYYLYVWDADGNNTHDYDQDTLEIAKEQAYEDFGVPMDSWIEALSKSP